MSNQPGEIKHPSIFWAKFEVPIQKKEYERLRNIVIADQGLFLLVIFSELKGILPDTFYIPNETYSFLILAVSAALLSTVFFLGSQIRRGFYEVAIRLAVASIFFVTYGFICMIPDYYDYKIGIYYFILVIIAALLMHEIMYVSRVFREHVGMGFYVAVWVIVFFISIISVPINEIIG
jgi:hypothetical protein